MNGPHLAELPVLDMRRLQDSAKRVVLVAPHPDDEVLAFGGLLQYLLRLRLPLLLVSVTDGNACYPGSAYWSAASLGAIRMAETATALRLLGWKPDQFTWLEAGLQDSAVHTQEMELAAYLESRFQRGDAIFTTWHRDGHSDHEAVARACAAAATAAGAVLYEAPVWAWQKTMGGELNLPLERLRLLPLGRAQLQLKKQALLSFSSQLSGDPHSSVAPILSPLIVQRACLPYEVIFV